MLNAINYKQTFKKELAKVYTDGELDILFKMLMADLKKHAFNSVLTAQVELNSAEEHFFNHAVNELKALKPIQHVLGKADFYGLHFTVSPHVLIPRPETEELVELIISENKNKVIDILDIGTGSGCIAITLKNQLPDANVSALDISLDAIAIAKQNAFANQATISFFSDDALNLLPTNYPKYDVIVSNPPYIAEKEKAEMEYLVTKNEPHVALFVKDNEPLIFYDKIADFALKSLKCGGTLYFEINQNFAKETKDLIESKGFTVDLIKDLNNNFRMIKARILG
ncbi:MAG TPA: peptide chain release factor N(5)-glutamine methyltransferase [Pelobium sp.]